MSTDQNSPDVPQSRDIDTPVGGIMTKEVGAITGPVTLIVDQRPDGTTQVRVAYQGAQEDYVVQGSPLDGTVDLDEVVTRLEASVQKVSDPDENPPAASL